LPGALFSFRVISFPAVEELLTIKEVAAKLKISPWTIRAWCSQKFIPYFKLRGSVRFREREVELGLKKNISLGRSVRRLRIGQHGIFRNRFVRRKSLIMKDTDTPFGYKNIADCTCYTLWGVVIY